MVEGAGGEPAQRRQLRRKAPWRSETRRTTSSGWTRWRAARPAAVQPEDPAREPAAHRGRREHHRRPHPRARPAGTPNAEPDTEIQFTPARVIMQDFTGVPCVVDLATMREAVADLGGDPTRINPLAPAELVIDHSVIADVFGTAGRVRAQRRDRVRAQRRALPVPALGPDRVRRLQGRPAGHRHRAPGQHRAPGPTVITTAGRAAAVAYPDTLRRHRLAHHDGQRPRRARLGRRRHRGRGGHARPARLDAHPERRRLQAHRRAARPAPPPPTWCSRSPRCCASTASSASSSSSTARASAPCRWPTAPRSAT